MLYDNLVTGLDGRLPLHMPGHKRNTALAPYLEALGARYDITEIAGYDNLHQAEGVLRDVMRRAERLYGAQRSFLLVNGSTAGILAAVRALGREGSSILLPRGSHLSAHQAAALCRMRPHYLYGDLDEQTGIEQPLTAETLARAIRECSDASLLLLTSPSYEGLLCDLKGMVRLAQDAGIRVVIDAAHGAHLGLHQVLPRGAVAAGADAVVHSLHKTMPSLTQTALLHTKAVHADRVAEQLQIFQTSSPSYLLMASIDACLQLVEEKGEVLFPAWARMLDDCRVKLKGLRHLRLLQGEHMDPSKVTVLCDRANISGYRLMERLGADYAMDLEMAGERYALAMSGLGEEAGTLRRFADALLCLDRGLEAVEKPPLAAPPQAEAVLPPFEALSRPFQLLSYEEAQGHCCAEFTLAYPPGSPVLVPGERITGEALEAMRQTGTLMKTRSRGRAGVLAVLQQCGRSVNSDALSLHPPLVLCDNTTINRCVRY